MVSTKNGSICKLTLRSITLPTEALDQRWDEVLDCLRAGSESEKKAEGPSPPVCADHFEGPPFADFFVGALREADTFYRETIASQDTLFFGQELARG